MIILLLCSTCMSLRSFGQDKKRSRDTTLVARLLATDSIFNPLNANRFGYKFYYGIHHLRIEAINIGDNSPRDTLIIAWVYNMRSEQRDYDAGFNLILGKKYIFDLAEFEPCKSDFPRLEGVCKQGQSFFPLSNTLIKKYSKIYRVINVSDWIERK